MEINSLKTAFQDLASRGAAMPLLCTGMDAEKLKQINTPGAWLMDIMYTVRNVLTKKVKPKASYTPVGNHYHILLMDECEIHGPWKDRNYNNRGNVMEYLAWLALEQDRCDMLVAMCVHYERLELSIARGHPEAKEDRVVLIARGNPNADIDRHSVDHYTQPYNDENIKAFAAMLRRQLKVDTSASAQFFAEKQWEFLIKDALEAAIFHLHDKEDQKRACWKSTASYSVILSRVLYQMKSDHALKGYINTSILKDDYKAWCPIGDSESIRLFECDNYVFSDSVLLLGKRGKQQTWINKYNTTVDWLAKNSEVRLKTVHGHPWQYHWNINKGFTTAELLARIKELIDEKAGGEPKQASAPNYSIWLLERLQ